MALGIGSRTFVGLKTESTYGTAPSFSLSADYTRCKSAAVRNRGAQTKGSSNLGLPWATGQRVHQQKSAGDVSMDMFYAGMERFFLHLMGSVATTSLTDASVKKHIFSPSVARQIGATLEVSADLVLMRYPGQKITRGKFGFKKNDPLEAIFSFIGLPHTSPSTPGAGIDPTTVTFREDASGVTAVNPVESANGFTFSVGTAGGSGYATVGIIEGDLTVDVPHAEDRGNLGSAVIAEPVPNAQPMMNISGSLKREFIDSSFITPFINGQQKAFKWSYKSPAAIVSVDYWLMEFEAKYVRFLETPPQVDGAGPIEDSIPFICESPDGSTPPLTITFQNRTATVS